MGWLKSLVLLIHVIFQMSLHKLFCQIWRERGISIVTNLGPKGFVDPILTLMGMPEIHLFV